MKKYTKTHEWLEIKDGARDYEVTVCFDTVGVKRMFASFAKLEKEE